MQEIAMLLSVNLRRGFSFPRYKKHLAHFFCSFVAAVSFLSLHSSSYAAPSQGAEKKGENRATVTLLILTSAFDVSPKLVKRGHVKEISYTIPLSL